MRIDERSAGFFAIGRALATDRPVAVVVTSGTAAAELHASVAEADQAFVPLLILTADRPPELHGVGAPQTIEQVHLYGDMVRHFEEPGVPRWDDAPLWRDVAKRCWRRCVDPTRGTGPVHLNAAFVEPLVGRTLSLPDATPVDEPIDEIENDVVDLGGLRVLCVVGRGVSASVIKDCTEMGWVVVGDATARGSLAYFDALLRVSSFVDAARPDVVVRLGGNPASKVLQEQLRAWGVRTVGFDGAGFVSDPDRAIGEHLRGVPKLSLVGMADIRYLDYWREASGRVDEWLGSMDSLESPLSEPLVARVVSEVSSDLDVALVVGSSMPVRDVEWWSASRTSSIFSNRGVNGIDGVVSTVFGVAAGSRSIGLIGDVTMLHDVSGFVDGLGDVGGTCVLVVVDNRGGGIFSFLSQATLLDETRFEKLFGTPRHHDLAQIARAFGLASTTVRTERELRGAISTGLGRGGITVVVVDAPSRERNVQIHDEWNQQVRRIVETVR